MLGRVCSVPGGEYSARLLTFSGVREACYMSDRQVSIRVGKGFWSRGPGPSTLITPTNLPAFEGQQGGGDDLALLFQAHMELTQLYSNARDVLYPSTSHREHLYLGGEYVRYIVSRV